MNQTDVYLDLMIRFIQKINLPQHKKKLPYVIESQIHTHNPNKKMTVIMAKFVKES